MLQQTVAAECVLQVRINLNLFGELQGLDLNEGGADSLHVALGVTESDSAGPNWVLVSVGVNSSVDNSSKQIIEDVSKTLGYNEYCLKPPWIVNIIIISTILPFNMP